MLKRKTKLDENLKLIDSGFESVFFFLNENWKDTDQPVHPYRLINFINVF